MADAVGQAPRVAVRWAVALGEPAQPEIAADFLEQRGDGGAEHRERDGLRQPRHGRRLAQQQRVEAALEQRREHRVDDDADERVAPVERPRLAEESIEADRQQRHHKRGDDERRQRDGSNGHDNPCSKRAPARCVPRMILNSARRRRAHVKLARQQRFVEIARAAVDALVDELDRAIADVVSRLTDRRHADQLRPVGIVDRDQRGALLPRVAEPRVQVPRDRERDGRVRREDRGPHALGRCRVDARIELGERALRRFRLLRLEHDRRMHRPPGGRHLRAERGLAQPPRAHVLERLHDEMKRLETPREQMPQACLDRGRVVEADHVGREAFDAAIDEHGRDAAAAQRFQRVLIGAERVDDHPFDAIGREQLQIAALHLELVGRVTDERHVAERMARGLDAAQHFDRVGIRQVRGKQAEEAVAAALQAARHLVRTVVQALDRGLDALAQVGGQYVRLAVQVARDAGFAGARLAGDVADRRGTRRLSSWIAHSGAS
ncbi:hypothetical protein BURPS1710b_2284 [Burkholderia pseudomallei 1710b]|uniref:Uncharacterized protein n=1 Tax=Burkholderia pseudomallei (strain 1710b) TaxID=320372 RepID=Q3JRX4_BURP1|nr:hypothetical protein BURPS1710b_2284 [Burkholderia pseudomallei 1710b]